MFRLFSMLGASDTVEVSMAPYCQCRVLFQIRVDSSKCAIQFLKRFIF